MSDAPSDTPGDDPRTADPIARFAAWWNELHALAPVELHPQDASGALTEAKARRIEASSAMIVSSVGADGRPSSRVVLLRQLDARGFVFYTNLESQKGKELLARPHAALNFHWPALDRQVRVEGAVSRVSDEEADTYFARRPRESQLGAHASDQSRPLASRDELVRRLSDARARFPDGVVVPRPDHWSGLRVTPAMIELWQAGEFRLHVRERYTRDDDKWAYALLFP